MFVNWASATAPESYLPDTTPLMISSASMVYSERRKTTRVIIMHIQMAM
jgi:hypothetical protein